MFAVFFLAGILIAGSLAYAGLVRGQLPLSKSKMLTGGTAKAIGLACLLLCLAMAAGIVISIRMMLKG